MNSDMPEEVPNEATPGGRLRMVRASRGDGVDAESQPKFIAEYNLRFGTNYDTTWLSRRENNRTAMTVEECQNFAKMDRDRRSAAWLAWGHAPFAYGDSAGGPEIKPSEIPVRKNPPFVLPAPDQRAVAGLEGQGPPPPARGLGSTAEGTKAGAPRRRPHRK